MLRTKSSSISLTRKTVEQLEEKDGTVLEFVRADQLVSQVKSKFSTVNASSRSLSVCLHVRTCFFPHAAIFSLISDFSTLEREERDREKGREKNGETLLNSPSSQTEFSYFPSSSETEVPAY